MSEQNIKGWPEGKSSFRELAREERDHICEMNPPEVEGVHHASLYFDWSWTGCGFGQLSVDFLKEEGKIEIMNECMSRDSVRKILHAWADFIADRAVLSDNPEDMPPVDFAAELEKIRKEHEAWQENRCKSKPEK